MTNQMSINEAAAQGIERLRLPVWMNKMDHLKVDIINGEAGPWIHIYSPFNQSFNGRDPVDILCINVNYDERVWEVYEGPLPDSDEYKERAELGAMTR